MSAEERDLGRSIPYPVRLGHGLMDLVERIPADLLPSSGGTSPRILVTISLDQLRTGLGTATLDTGTEVSVGQGSRLACEAGIIPAVLGGTSQPLDLGREKRLHTESQRLAMVLRYGPSCVIDGCDVPAAWCEAHHPEAWQAGGQTSLVNGILVCPYHHRLSHSSSWELLHENGIWRLRRVRC